MSSGSLACRAFSIVNKCRAPLDTPARHATHCERSVQVHKYTYNSINLQTTFYLTFCFSRSTKFPSTKCPLIISCFCRYENCRVKTKNMKIVMLFNKSIFCEESFFLVPNWFFSSPHLVSVYESPDNWTTNLHNFNFSDLNLKFPQQEKNSSGRFFRFVRDSEICI